MVGALLYFAIRRAGIGIYLEPMDHVVVVGAGIGGLAASLVLSRVAKRVTLVERADHPAEVGAALAFASQRDGRSQPSWAATQCGKGRGADRPDGYPERWRQGPADRQDA